jgi:hypothetical protein
MQCEGTSRSVATLVRSHLGRGSERRTKKEVVPVKLKGLLSGMRDSMSTRSSFVNPWSRRQRPSRQRQEDGTYLCDQMVGVDPGLLLLQRTVLREERGRCRRRELRSLRWCSAVGLSLDKDEWSNGNLIVEVLHTRVSEQV